MSFMEIFQPGLKFLRQERERQRMDVVHPTDGADPLMEIDLDAGTATITVPPPARTADPGETNSEPGESAADQPAADAEPGPDGR